MRKKRHTCSNPRVNETPRVSAPAGVSRAVCMSKARCVSERPCMRVTACVRSLYTREMSVAMHEHVAVSPGVSLSVECSRRRHSRHTLLRVTTPRLHSIAFTLILTSGDAAACSCMATVISRVYSDRTHAVTLTHPTHGRSLTRASLTHTTPAGALTRGVSLTQGGSHTRAASRAHVASSPCGAPFTHGAPGSGTCVRTPLCG